MAVVTEQGNPQGGGARRNQVTGRVDIDAEGDLAHWLKVLDTSHEELLAAIEAVGTDAGDVSAYLKRGSDAEPAPAGPHPDGG